MRRSAGTLALVLVALLGISGCITSGQEVVREEDGAAVPGIAGEYYRRASPDDKETIRIGGAQYATDPVPLALGADGRSYVVGSPAQGPVRFMRLNKRFYLAQSPWSAQDSEWFVLALARIDANAGVIDLHCIVPPPPADAQGNFIEELLTLGGPDLFKGPADRESTLKLAREWAERDPPLFVRFVRADAARRGGGDPKTVPAGPAVCLPPS